LSTRGVRERCVFLPLSSCDPARECHYLFPHSSIGIWITHNQSACTHRYGDVY
ncbi:Uncharacterized protein APZ42_001532, partial [Daphnia magna]